MAVTTPVRIREGTFCILTSLLFYLAHSQVCTLLLIASPSSSVGRAFDCRHRRYRMVPGSIPGGRILFFRMQPEVYVLFFSSSERPPKQFDSLAERSKAPDSSSGGAIRVGSNPTAYSFLHCVYSEQIVTLASSNSTQLVSFV